MPALRSGRTSAAATSSPATASACTTALDIRSVRYSSYACASTPLITRSSTPASRSHSAARRAWLAASSPVWSWSRSWNRPGQAPEFLVLFEPPSERAHHALDRDQVTDGGLLQALLAAERDGGLAIHHPSSQDERHAGEHHPWFEQEQTLHEQRVLVVQEQVPPLPSEELRNDDDDDGVGIGREPPHLLEHRPREIAERRLDDVERDRHAALAPLLLHPVRGLGVQIEVDRTGRRRLERERVVHRSRGGVVHAGDEDERDHSLRDQRTAVHADRPAMLDRDGHVGHDDVLLAQQPGLQAHESGPPKQVAEHASGHNLGHDHVDEVRLGTLDPTDVACGRLRGGSSLPSGSGSRSTAPIESCAQRA